MARRKSTKAGDAYQHAVGDVARSLDPTAVVEIGSWVAGPDGRRDLDIVVRPKTGGPPLACIECKDWNRPIGIAFIDALESKRRDIGAGLAMICSNSGFSADALRKATRVGIPALAALIEGDNRIRVVVAQQLYAPIVQFERSTTTLHDIPNDVRARIGDAPFGALMFQDKSMDRWLASECTRLAWQASRSRSLTAKYVFKQPFFLTLASSDLQIPVTSLELHVTFSVRWFTKVYEIGASKGMYDYLKQCVVVGPGPYQFQIKGVNIEEWGTEVSLE